MNDKSNILGSIMPPTLQQQLRYSAAAAAAAGDKENNNQQAAKAAINLAQFGISNPASSAARQQTPDLQRPTSGKQHKLRQRFTVIRKLGKGTYGKVQLAVNKETGQEVAIKTIKKTKIENEQDLQRVRREIQIMSSIEHPHIIHIYEVFENKDKIVLVMQYAPGGELYEYVSRSKLLDDSEARRLFRQIATAIYYCHQNKICHRDLKLENILLDEKNNAKLADFGLSNVFDKRRQLKTFCGSPLYASPEIVLGSPYEGPEVDCWSLGVLLYTLVYGAMPFDGSNFKRLVKQISEACYVEPKQRSSASPLIRRLLCADPKERANILDICSDPWVNGQTGGPLSMTAMQQNDRSASPLRSLSPVAPSQVASGTHHSLLKVAQDMANLTPVRFDILLALTPTSPPIVAEELVLENKAPPRPPPIAAHGAERRSSPRAGSAGGASSSSAMMKMMVEEEEEEGEERSTTPVASFVVRDLDHNLSRLPEAGLESEQEKQNQIHPIAGPGVAPIHSNRDDASELLHPENLEQGPTDIADIVDEESGNNSMQISGTTSSQSQIVIDATPGTPATIIEQQMLESRAKDEEIKMEVDLQLIGEGEDLMNDCAAQDERLGETTKELDVEGEVNEEHSAPLDERSVTLTSEEKQNLEEKTAQGQETEALKQSEDEQQQKQAEVKPKKVIKKKIVVVKRKKKKQSQDVTAVSQSQNEACDKSKLEDKLAVEEQKGNKETTSPRQEESNEESSTESQAPTKVREKKGKPKGPGKIHIPNTFQAASDSTATNETPPRAAPEGRRQSTLVADVSQKLFQHLLQQQQAAVAGLAKEEQPQLANVRVSDKKSEFERRASMALNVLPPIQLKGSHHHHTHQQQQHPDSCNVVGYEPEKVEHVCEMMDDRSGPPIEYTIVEPVNLKESQQAATLDFRLLQDGNLNLPETHERQPTNEIDTKSSVEICRKKEEQAEVERKLNECIDQLTNTTSQTAQDVPELNEQYLDSNKLSPNSNIRDDRSDSAETIKPEVNDSPTMESIEPRTPVATNIRTNFDINLKSRDKHDQTGMLPNRNSFVSANLSSAGQLALGPAPIARSYKKVTFTKDGACVTETGKIYSTQADDGTLRRVERKSKVTHYPTANRDSSSLPDGNTSSVQQTEEAEEETIVYETGTIDARRAKQWQESSCTSSASSMRRQQQMRRPFEKLIMPSTGFLDDEFDDEGRCTTDASEFMVRRSSLSRQSQQQQQPQKYPQPQPGQRQRADSASSCSSGSTDIFDDIFDTWTGAISMFQNQGRKLNSAGTGATSSLFGNQHRRVGPQLPELLFAGLPSRRSSSRHSSRNVRNMSPMDGRDSAQPRSGSAFEPHSAQMDPFEPLFGDSVPFEGDFLRNIELEHKNLKQRLAQQHKQLWKGSTPSLLSSLHDEDNFGGFGREHHQPPTGGLWQYLRGQEADKRGPSSEEQGAQKQQQQQQQQQQQPAPTTRPRSVSGTGQQRSLPTGRNFQPQQQRQHQVSKGAEQHLEQSQSSSGGFSLPRPAIPLDSAPTRRSTCSVNLAAAAASNQLPPRQQQPEQTMRRSVSKTSFITSSSAQHVQQVQVESTMTSSKVVSTSGSSSAFWDNRATPVTSISTSSGCDENILDQIGATQAEKSTNKPASDTQEQADIRMQSWLQESVRNMSSSSSGFKSSIIDKPATTFRVVSSSSLSSQQHLASAPISKNSDGLNWIQMVESNSHLFGGEDDSLSGAGSADLESQSSSSLLDQLRSRGYRSMINQRIVSSSSMTQHTSASTDQSGIVGSMASTAATSSVAKSSSRIVTSGSLSGANTMQQQQEERQVSTSSNKELSSPNRQLNEQDNTLSIQIGMDCNSVGVEPATKEDIFNSDWGAEETVGTHSGHQSTTATVLQKQTCNGTSENIDSQHTTAPEAGVVLVGENEDENEKEEEEEDDDVKEAKASIKSHLDRVRETELFLKSCQQEEENMERQRKQLFQFNNLLLSTKLNGLRSNQNGCFRDESTIRGCNELTKHQPLTGAWSAPIRSVYGCNSLLDQPINAIEVTNSTASASVTTTSTQNTSYMPSAALSFEPTYTIPRLSQMTSTNLNGYSKATSPLRSSCFHIDEGCLSANSTRDLIDMPLRSYITTAPYHTDPLEPVHAYHQPLVAHKTNCLDNFSIDSHSQRPRRSRSQLSDQFADYKRNRPVSAGIGDATTQSGELASSRNAYFPSRGGARRSFSQLRYGSNRLSQPTLVSEYRSAYGGTQVRQTSGLQLASTLAKSPINGTKSPVRCDFKPTPSTNYNGALASDDSDDDDHGMSAYRASAYVPKVVPQGMPARGRTYQRRFSKQESSSQSAGWSKGKSCSSAKTSAADLATPFSARLNAEIGHNYDDENDDHNNDSSTRRTRRTSLQTVTNETKSRTDGNTDGQCRRRTSASALNEPSSEIVGTSSRLSELEQRLLENKRRREELLAGKMSPS